MIMCPVEYTYSQDIQPAKRAEFHVKQEFYLK